MSCEVKLALFWLGVYLAVALVRASPVSTFGRIALAWIGSIQQEGELRSRYLHRQARYALGWLAQLLVIAALLVLLCKAVPALAHSEAFLIVASFALVIGTGMALLGALLAWLGSIKAARWGPDPAWHAPVEAVEDDEFDSSGP
ncbi:MAG: hypothetical protein M3N82_09305 [Pseudomonadota bacterium]|nr:hypothetical protein [Pseudomonadota bacterium]